MFHAYFPQFFGGSVIGQFKTDGRFELFESPGSDFNVKIVPFVGNL